MECSVHNNMSKGLAKVARCCLRVQSNMDASGTRGQFISGTEIGLSAGDSC